MSKPIPKSFHAWRNEDGNWRREELDDQPIRELPQRKDDDSRTTRSSNSDTGTDRNA